MPPDAEASEVCPPDDDPLDDEPLDVPDDEPPEEVLPLVDPLDVPLEELVEPLDAEPEDEDPLDEPLVDASTPAPESSLLQPPTAPSAARKSGATVPNRREDFMGYLEEK
jgi:hypothetical protein